MVLAAVGATVLLYMKDCGGLAWIYSASSNSIGCVRQPHVGFVGVTRRHVLTWVKDQRCLQFTKNGVCVAARHRKMSESYATGQHASTAIFHHVHDHPAVTTWL